MSTATVGTGTITLGSAVSGYLSFAGAGTVDGDIIDYAVNDGANSEIGSGLYTAAGTTLTRVVSKSTNSNNAISLSGTAQVFITPQASTLQPARGLGFENLSLAASVAANILTVALKDSSGTDCTAASSATIQFRNATAATGTVSTNYVTAALSITTNAVGASLGSLSNTAFRFWVLAFDNAGTTVLALFNATSAATTTPTIFPLNEGAVASTTAMSGSATSAGVFYTPNGTTLTSKAFRILGYVEYNSTGLATAGTYATAPNFIQLFGIGVRKPGEEVQRISNISGTSSTTTTVVPQDNTIPQITEGKEFMNVTLIPSSAANLIEIDSRIMGACSAGDTVTAALFRDAIANALSAMPLSNAANFMQDLSLIYIQQAAAVASTIYRLRAGPAVGTTTFTFNGQSGAALYGGVAGSSMIAKEIMG